MVKYTNFTGAIDDCNIPGCDLVEISRQPSPVTIMIDPKQLENVECFKYLGII